LTWTPARRHSEALRAALARAGAGGDRREARLHAAAPMAPSPRGSPLGAVAGAGAGAGAGTRRGWGVRIEIPEPRAPPGRERERERARGARALPSPRGPFNGSSVGGRALLSPRGAGTPRGAGGGARAGSSAGSGAGGGLLPPSPFLVPPATTFSRRSPHPNGSKGGHIGGPASAAADEAFGLEDLCRGAAHCAAGAAGAARRVATALPPAQRRRAAALAAAVGVLATGVVIGLAAAGP